MTLNIPNFCPPVYNQNILKLTHIIELYKAYNDMLPYNLQIYFEKSNCRRQIHCVKVEECNEPSCEALIFPYGVVLFNIFSTICI